ALQFSASLLPITSRPERQKIRPSDPFSPLSLHQMTSRGPNSRQPPEGLHGTGGNFAAVGNFKNILLAEDSPDDVFLIRSAFKKSGFPDPIYVVSNGEQVLQYLKGEGSYADRKEYPVPHLLLLDLNMPRLNGFEVLSWIRGRQEWMCLPVIVLT